MNRILARFFSLGAILMSLASCVSNKDMIYVQGIDGMYSQAQAIGKDFGLLVQPDDQLAILVTSKDEELINQFNNAKVINSGSNGSQSYTQSGLTYFYVEKDGTINFPILGTIKVKGLTVEQVSQKIQDMIRASYIKDASVTTKIMSFKVTVLGDVGHPGVQSFTGQRLTLLEAIGGAGDLNNTAIRKNVLVIREENGRRITYRVDLTDPQSVFVSPAYYLQQNDLVYVESNKATKVKGSTSYTYLTVSGTLVGVVASIAALVVTLTK